jgi:hypothetical protein
MEQLAFAAVVAACNQPSLQVHFPTHQPYLSPFAVLVVVVSPQRRPNFVTSAVGSSLYQQKIHQKVVE